LQSSTWHWVHTDRWPLPVLAAHAPPPLLAESKELLTYCIKRVRGLQKVKLVDAAFIWTEPHSMRLKVKLTVQGEVLNGAILQQAFVVEYVVERHMCPTCNRQNANPNSWVACVQVGTPRREGVGRGGTGGLACSEAGQPRGRACCSCRSFCGLGGGLCRRPPSLACGAACAWRSTPLLPLAASCARRYGSTCSTSAPSSSWSSSS
jgi:hypothetical protein